jgi:hypothetical protein
MTPDRQLARNGFDAGLKVRFLSVTIATGHGLSGMQQAVLSKAPAGCLSARSKRVSPRRNDRSQAIAGEAPEFVEGGLAATEQSLPAKLHQIVRVHRS